MTSRSAKVERVTKETKVRCHLVLDGSGQAQIDTGLGFLDHMLTTLIRHAHFDAVLSCQGDLHVDDHHTAEDCGLTLGEALDKALGERRAIRRFGSAYAPLDEALARAVIDLGGRPYATIELGLGGGTLGGVRTENLVHTLSSLATAARASLHIDVLRGSNDHHRAESAFKAMALALRHAVGLDEVDEIPSTKGVLT